MYICELTGVRTRVGRTVSKSLQRNRRFYRPNLHVRRFWSSIWRRNLKLRVSARVIKMIRKSSLDQVISCGNAGTMSPQLRRLFGRLRRCQ